MSTTSLNNPMVNNSQELSGPKYTLVTPTEGENPKELADFMKTEGFRKQILQIIRSLSKTEPATLEEDANPLLFAILAQVIISSKFFIPSGNKLLFITSFLTQTLDELIKPLLINETLK